MEIIDKLVMKFFYGIFGIYSFISKLLLLVFDYW